MNESILPRICGSEMEYGHIVTGQSGNIIQPAKYFKSMRQSLPEGLQTTVTGGFLSNGGRLYKDVGEHIEFATPECDSISDVVTYEMAGDQILLRSFERIRQEGVIGDYRLQRRISDEYGHLHGAHESYQMHRRINQEAPPALLALAAHFATRSVFSGAGRVNEHGFSVTQKAQHLAKLTFSCAHSPDNRPLIDTRDEVLDDNELFRRLHVSHGDANLLPYAKWLKMGSTSLVLRMLENGIDLSDLSLMDPLEAAWKVGEDSSLKKTITLSSGRMVYPKQVQAKLAERAAEMAERIALPAEELEIIREWRQTSDDLGPRTDKLIGKIDWITKKHIIDRFVAKHPGTDLNDIHARDLTYDLLGREAGLASKLLSRHNLPKQPSAESVENAIVNPPTSTRAYLRGKAILAATELDVYGNKNIPINWHYVKLQGVEHKISARDTQHPVIDDFINDTSQAA